MTRRRFYAPPIAFSHDGQSATLSADETRHLRDVLRLRVGDEAYVFDGEGREFHGSVSNTDRSSSVVRIFEEAQPPSPESPLNLTLAVALLKGEKFDVVVQKAAELGAACVVPLITSRADVRIHNPEDAQKKQARWQRIALEATKQCGRAKLIKIDAPIAFAEFVARLPVNNQLYLMFSERDGIPLADAVDSIEQPSSVKAIVGSEGGWTDEEIQQAHTAQWKIVTLGGRTLRAETAAITVATLLQHRFGDLK
ncbi:MAG TPA: 16S rRNA (uracil(1498)-N(3))-methyltransferase [Pyrinomonadaceae bacterium]|nr:16S rRNA (uracil(1498)-N(3))-methyltransferase [Pyrinomonadaceae bacterium]